MLLKKQIFLAHEKRVYSKELKQQAVQLSYQQDNIKELADELGIDVQRIYKWCKAAKQANIHKYNNLSRRMRVKTDNQK